jgi:CheY-like chemotaxis protein
MATGLLLCDDLIFSSRVTGTARDLGLSVKAAPSAERLRALASAEQPAGVIVDLSIPGLVIEELIGWLRQNVSPMPRVVAYGSHVDTATLRRAREAGCDPVLPRSKFVEDLPVKLVDWLQQNTAEARGGPAMAAPNFDQLWEGVRALDSEHLQRLRHLIDALLTVPELRDAAHLSATHKLGLALMKDGLLTKIPPPPTEAYIKAFREYQPVPIQGKPLSETVIEDRS